MNPVDFLRIDCLENIESISESSLPSWGIMNPQEMVEHLTLVFTLSVGDVEMPLVTPEEHLPKYLEFLRSEKLFRENTKAPTEIVGEKPLPLSCNNLATAKTALTTAIDKFFIYFKNNTITKTSHPVFGPLNYEDWLLLHYKHTLHHLRQFGLYK